MILKNKVVTLHYKLQEENSEGELIEETYGSDPLKFIFGIGHMIPGFEANLEGKTTGDTFEFTLTPEDAYGSYEEEAVIEVPLQNFQDDEGNIDAEKFKVGEPIHMEDQEGRQFQGTIVELDEEIVVIDFNHPMAGVVLHFSGEITEVRDATESELDHGHVH